MDGPNDVTCCGQSDFRFDHRHVICKVCGTVMVRGEETLKPAPITVAEMKPQKFTPMNHYWGMKRFRDVY